MNRPDPDRRRRIPETAGRVLDKLFRDLEIADRLADYEIWNVWDEVVGEQVARVTKPIAFAKGKLTVQVVSAAWHHALRQESAKIAEKLNNRIGRRSVREIRFREGYVRKEPKLEATPAEAAPLARSAAERAARLSEEIADPALREAVRRAGEALARRRG